MHCTHALMASGFHSLRSNSGARTHRTVQITNSWLVTLACGLLPLASFLGKLRKEMITVKVNGLVWLGTRTEQFGQMLTFCQEVMGLKTTHEEPDFAVLDMPNGDKFEIFGPESSYNRFMTYPVAGFLVDDIGAARAEMEAYGIEFIGPIHTMEDGYAWSHFRAPDGFIYSLTYSPSHPST